ncbi:auxin response factor 1 isoform X1 [Cajanus cajan]|nr:auxin response factor 1 isoform X1 [Cajanus cajan]XP_020210375.1 auxin response factor 1 isoform X1 [Cajanus cajan]
MFYIRSHQVPPNTCVKELCICKRLDSCILSQHTSMSTYSSPIASGPSVSQPNAALKSEQSTPALTLPIHHHPNLFPTSQPKSQTGYARSGIKVFKKGMPIARSVNLTQLRGYDELIHKLDQLFEFGGQLISSQKNWLIAYTDYEEDIMLVGDDPWEEFVVMARKIYIYPKDDFQKMMYDERSIKEIHKQENENFYKEFHGHIHKNDERLPEGSDNEMQNQKNDTLCKQFRGKQKIIDSESSWPLLTSSTDRNTNTTLSNSHDYSGPS